MKKGVEVLKPHLGSGAAGVAGKLIIGTVAGDLHDIGKNLVAMMIESAGFEVIDLGVDVPVNKFIEAVHANPDVKIVALSALSSRKTLSHITQYSRKRPPRLQNLQTRRPDVRYSLLGNQAANSFAFWAAEAASAV